MSAAGLRIRPGRAGQRRGFTAPEIIVATVIVGLCTFVILRADTAAQRRAHNVCCLTNVKQLGAALLMYAADNGLRLPPHGDAWHSVYPYVRNVQLFVCPLVPAGASSAGTTIPATPGPVGPTWVGSDYLLKAAAQADDLPETVLAGDNAAGRHQGRWLGARLDGAGAFYPAAEWETRLGGMRDVGSR